MMVYSGDVPGFTNKGTNMSDEQLLAELKEHILQQGYEAFLMWAVGSDDVRTEYCAATGLWPSEDIDKFIEWVTENYWGDE
jgi:hypothetical protein